MIIETRPKHILDWLLWPILRLIWEPVSRKQAHWWHWRKYYFVHIEMIEVAGDPMVKPRNNIWNNFWQSNFAWHEVVVFKVVNQDGSDYIGTYQIGFYSKTEKRRQLCSILLTGQCACLLGHFSTNFFVIADQNRRASLKIIKITKKECLESNILLI